MKRKPFIKENHYIVALVMQLPFEVGDNAQRQCFSFCSEMHITNSAIGNRKLQMKGCVMLVIIFRSCVQLIKAANR